MNSSDLTIHFKHPWLLMLLIPALVLAMIPYLRLPRKRRRTRNRIVSLVIHIVCIVICVLLLAGITFRTEKVLTSFDTIFVVDLSDSSAGTTEDMEEYLRTVLNEERASDFHVGLVTFAGDQDTPVEVERLRDPEKVVERLHDASLKKTDSTDVASALYYAKDLLKETVNSRIILLSDGLNTDGDEMTAARSLASSGIRVDAMFFEPSPASHEMQISSVTVDEDAAAAGRADLIVTLESASACTVRLTLSDNGKQCVSQVVELAGGVQTVSFSQSLSGTGLHELCVRAESEDDTIPQNNVFYTFVNMDASARVLVISNTAGESADMETVLRTVCKIDSVRPEKAPNTSAKLNEYAEIILVNVSMNALPKGYDTLLRQYTENGGGLLVVGGQNTLALGQIAGTALEEVLPVTLEDGDEQVLELMIVMDISSSMDKAVSGSKKKRLAVAKEGAIESINALRDSDFAGVVTFDENATVLVEISPATGREKIVRSINNVRVGFGTKYGNALTTARNLLQASKNNADRQHVIFLTDGAPGDSGFEGTIKSMAARGITLTTIAIFDERDPDLGDINVLKNRVRDMAALGGGRCYILSDASQLPDIMRTETQLTQRKVINEETVQPEMKDYSPVLQGVGKLPEIKGYMGVGVKEGAVVPYVAGDDPLYVEWTFGSGHAAVFTSTFGGTWAQNFLSAEDGRTFLKNVVTTLMNTEDAMTVETETRNFVTSFRVLTPVLPKNSARASIKAPDGNREWIDLNAAGTDSYAGSFRKEVSGIYRINVTVYDERGNGTSPKETYLPFSYSAEYDVFRDPQLGYQCLNDVCQATGGHILLPTEAVFSTEALTVTRTHDPAIPLLIAAIILFLLDIAVRKFKFKWIHELIRPAKEDET